MKIVVRLPTFSDVEYIAENMRQADIDEINASSGITPLEALREGIEISAICRTFEINDVKIAMAGIVSIPDFEDVGIVWMLGTNDIKKYSKSFTKVSRETLKHIFKIYSKLINYVDCRNETAIKWLLRLGADMGESSPFGKQLLPFRYFELRRKR